MEEPKDQEQDRELEQNENQNNQNVDEDLNLDLAAEPEQNQTEQQPESPPEEPLVPDTSQPELEAEEPQATLTPEPMAPVIPPKKRFWQSKKFLLLVLVCVLLIVAVAAGWYFVYRDNDSQPKTNTAQKASLMGAEVSIVDGTAQISTDNKTWKVVKAGDQIAQGTYLKTEQSGRVVIALDDGSAIRINNNSSVKINNLDTTNVVITNNSGEVYTRLVKSERKFSVVIDGENYVSMGTAYKTVNTAEIKGVEVYESKVKLSKINLEVPEGKFYYAESKDTTQQQKVSDIPIDKAKQDAFLAWNYEQDKNSSEFNKALGYLGKVYATTPTPTATPQANVSASVKLNGSKYDSGVKLSWSLSNVTAPKGFKVVKSLSANPAYGKDDAVYVSDPNSRSYAWTIKDGKTYHFRVCVYTGSGCSLYSNDIAVTAPYVAVAEPSGTLSLTSTGGKNFSWVLNGSAPNGFKLVWSTEHDPVYPSPNATYYDASKRDGSIGASSSGTYYVRVCMYKSSGCVNYSNELPVTLY